MSVALREYKRKPDDFILWLSEKKKSSARDKEGRKEVACPKICISFDLRMLKLIKKIPQVTKVRDGITTS